MVTRLFLQHHTLQHCSGY